MSARPEVVAADRVPLPAPDTTAAMPVADALRLRRSHRVFRDAPLPLEALAALLWAGQGQTGDGSLRTAPSAGALYPLTLYVVAGAVEGLAPAVYRYVPGDAMLFAVRPGDQRTRLAEAAVDQDWLARAPAVIVIAGAYERTLATYGKRGERYVHLEAGHAGQNVYLMAAARGLGVGYVGSFNDDLVRARLGMRKSESPLALLPAGLP